MKKLNIKKLLIFPYLWDLYNELKLSKEISAFPPGHYYSPIVDSKSLKDQEDRIWKDKSLEILQDIELNDIFQIQLLNSFVPFYQELPFKSKANESQLRYYYENNFYSYSDGIMLFCMLRFYKPKRIIEIGSGFSSSLMLDTNNLFFRNSIQLTFIDPFPERLISLLNPTKDKDVNIISKPVQQVDLSHFGKLEAGDILFIDSSHVVKTGSDLHYILFKIIPELSSGVIIHFHDIFYPFEYPKKWVFEGRNWNENYFLRAFLMNNSSYQIILFTNYMHVFHKELFESMPLCFKNRGANLWLRKN